jgi:hypothetical protein
VRSPRGSRGLHFCSFEETVMSEGQSLSSIVPLAVIERPSCPNCQAQMLLARIVPALLGTTLRTFECAACKHVLKTLAACENTK